MLKGPTRYSSGRYVLSSLDDFYEKDTLMYLADRGKEILENAGMSVGDWNNAVIVGLVSTLINLGKLPHITKKEADDE